MKWLALAKFVKDLVDKHPAAQQVAEGLLGKLLGKGDLKDQAAKQLLQRARRRRDRIEAFQQLMQQAAQDEGAPLADPTLAGSLAMLLQEAAADVREDVELAAELAGEKLPVAELAGGRIS